MAEDLPYRVEYSKSGRAACKVCKNPIPKDSLRIATVVQVRAIPCLVLIIVWRKYSAGFASRESARGAFFLGLGRGENVTLLRCAFWSRLPCYAVSSSAGRPVVLITWFLDWRAARGVIGSDGFFGWVIWMIGVVFAVVYRAPSTMAKWSDGITPTAFSKSNGPRRPGTLLTLTAFAGRIRSSSGRKLVSCCFFIFFLVWLETGLDPACGCANILCVSRCIVVHAKLGWLKFRSLGTRSCRWSKYFNEAGFIIFFAARKKNFLDRAVVDWE